jgi:hypothetical protein
MKKKKNYTKENCSSQVRATIKDQYGRTITLVGRHAFEWSIVVDNGVTVKVTTFSNSNAAKKEFKKLSK